MNWKDEPKAIKAALQAHGFTVLRARKGTGTARSWNMVKVAEKNRSWSWTYTEAARIAEATCGHGNVSISVD